MVSGHFGELLQGRLGPGGSVALVTLATPDPAFAAAASWRPARGAPLSTAGSPLAGRAGAALQAGLRAAGRRGWGGRLEIRTAAPLGGGCGASTAALLAALRLAGAGLAPLREAALCLALEGAVDPLALAEPGGWLWASRAARPLLRLGRPPRFWVAGGFDGPPQRTDPATADFAEIDDLIGPLRAAFAAGDAAALAALSTLSARRHQARRPKPRFDAAAALAEERGALGLVAAHTGPALGLLFRADQAREAAAAARALGALGLSRPLSFPAGPAAAAPGRRICPSRPAARS